MKKKILFCHFDLAGGGAEKVLVNLLHGLNPNKYDITLFLLFGVGPYIDKLPEYVKVKCLFKKQFRGLTQILKLFSPKLLHKLLIKGCYDLEIAYLETSPTRIISGAPDNVRKIAWVHVEEEQENAFYSFYRSGKEMVDCYNRFDKIAFVSKTALRKFEQNHPQIVTPKCVMYNVNDIDILTKAKEGLEMPLSNKLNICTIGRLNKQKGYVRLLQAVKEINELGLSSRFTLYILGKGEDEDKLKDYIKENNLNNVVMLGFQPNPYKYLSRMDLFVCSSFKEGYSTAVVESTLLGIPVITTDCSGMDEILKDGRYGMIVPNNQSALFEGMKNLIEHRERIDTYKRNLQINVESLYAKNVKKYEDLFDEL